MLRFTIGKMLSKRWMCICLLIGNILFIGIAASNPMYFQGASDKMMQSNFVSASKEASRDIGFINMESKWKIADGKITGKMAGQVDEEEDISSEKLQTLVDETFHIPVKRHVEYLQFPSAKAVVSMRENPEGNYNPAWFSDLKEHGTITAGTWWDETEVEDGVIPCVVTQKASMSQTFMLGQTITFQEGVDEKTGKPPVFQIVGVFEKKEGDDTYWYKDPSSYVMELFISDEAKEQFLKDVTFGENAREYDRNIYAALDTEKINISNAGQVLKDTNSFIDNVQEIGEIDSSVPIYKVIREFQSGTGRLRLTMWLLEIPVLILLVVFIYMVSGQMLSMEENEIAMLKSRGVSRVKLLGIYFLQAFGINLCSGVVGIFLGLILCKIIGASNSFMEFVSRRALPLRFTWDIIWYVLGAMLASIIIMTMPVLPASKVTIVEKKQDKRKKRPWWRVCFLDIILLVISLYTYSNFQKNQEQLAVKIAETGEVDPLLLISASVFILGCALFALRIFPVITWLVYRVGKKRWKPAMYASFLQIIRSGGNQSFISVFLIATIAFGIFNASTARTVNNNQESLIYYNNGTDLVLQEAFLSNRASVQRAIDNGDIPGPKLVYQEPDYYKYEELKDAQVVTRVLDIAKNHMSANHTTESESDGIIYEDSSSIIINENTRVLGIEPKKFGECCWFRNDLDKKQWYEALNALSEKADGMIVTNSAKKKYGLKVGDTVTCDMYDEMDRRDYLYATGTIVAFVDYFPTFQESTRVQLSETEYGYEDSHMVVANFDYLMSQTDVLPYKIFIKTDNIQEVYDFVEENNIKLTDIKDSRNQVIIAKNEPILQVSNGLLTIGFVVILLICVTGFLIYWIGSIRSRELLFGIYRAMGLSAKELMQMLINEHIFSTLLAIVIGGVVGVVSAKLFVPMMEITYTKDAQSIPLHVTMDTIDGVRLAVTIVCMVVFCIMVLRRIIAKLKISQALKLGED